MFSGSYSKPEMDLIGILGPDMTRKKFDYLFGGWERGGTLRRLKCRATPECLNQRLNMEEVISKMARRRSSDTGQSRRKRVRYRIGPARRIFLSFYPA